MPPSKGPRHLPVFPPHNRCHACKTVLCTTNNSPDPAATQVCALLVQTRNPLRTVPRPCPHQARLADLTSSHCNATRVHTRPPVSTRPPFLQKGRVLQTVASPVPPRTPAGLVRPSAQRRSAQQQRQTTLVLAMGPWPCFRSWRNVYKEGGSAAWSCL